MMCCVRSLNIEHIGYIIVSLWSCIHIWHRKCLPSLELLQYALVCAYQRAISNVPYWLLQFAAAVIMLQFIHHYTNICVHQSSFAWPSFALCLCLTLSSPSSAVELQLWLRDLLLLGMQAMCTVCCQRPERVMPPSF